MASIFEQTIVPKIPFSNFPLNETQLISHNFGQLIPCYVREVIPNDVFDLSLFADSEFAPMVAPMKQDVNLSVHFFFTPDRILFDGWETFITGAEDGHALTTEAELSRMPAQPGWPAGKTYKLFDQNDSDADFQGSILDYLGLPNELFNVKDEGQTPDNDLLYRVISDLPLRAYFKIWYDYYRDENLQYAIYQGYQQNEVTYYDIWRAWKSRSATFDVNSETNIRLLFGGHMLPFYRSFKKDYFTGCLPSPQKGEPVTIALGSTAPVTLNTQSVRLQGRDGTLQESNLNFKWSDSVDTTNPSNLVIGPTSHGFTDLSLSSVVDSESGEELMNLQGSLDSMTATGWTKGQIQGLADLSKASAITVEALREAFAVQEILESLSLRGSRYVEFLRGNFGVTPDDYKLQRPQFLGGVVTPVAVQRVLQTSGYSGTDSRDMTGYAAGRAYAAAGKRVFRQRFKEHGYIIGIMSAMPKAYYYQGIPRHFMRNDRFDYYMVQTAHLGEQAVENCELFVDAISDSNNNTKVFGFIPRWAEYKIAYNGIHGDFRGSLNYYHMARVFSELPTLSEEFITTKNLQTRPFAVWQAENPNINHLIWTNLFFKVTASRPIPYHSIPKVQ